MHIKNIILFICAIHLFPGQLHAITTSIIIPCNYKHAQHLPGLLRLLEQQTVLPDEVVISLSDASKVDRSLIDTINNTDWQFPCVLLISNKVQYAGENRNIACRHAMGDIFILQDADDIPHPKRVEVIRHTFENHPQADHLMHEYFMIKNANEKINFAPIHPDSMRKIWNQPFDKVHTHGSFTNGNIALTRALFQEMQWSDTMARGQDTEYNRGVYKKNKQRILIKAPLLCYRIYLTSSKSKPSDLHEPF